MRMVWHSGEHGGLGGGSVVQWSVTFSGAYVRSHPSPSPLNPTTFRPPSLTCRHLLYSDVIFTYLWNQFDGDYQPVKPTEEFVAGGKLKKRAAEVISFESLNRLVGFRWNVQCARGNFLSFCHLSYSIHLYFSM